MPTSTTKVTLLESDYKESVLLGPFLIRNWDTTKYVNGDGTTPALTAAGDGKLNTWAFDPIPNGYRRYHVYQSPAIAPANKYRVLNITKNNTLAIDVVDSLNKATEWTIEATNHVNVYMFSIAVKDQSGNTPAPLCWTRQLDGHSLALEKLDTTDRAKFVLEEISL